MSDRKRLLIVEDEGGMREMLRWWMREHEFEILTVADGAEALEALAREEIDLVVTDLTMPRLNGFQLLEAMRGRLARTPVIMVTGFGTVESAVYAMRRGARDFILKPYDPQRLLARIREVLGAEAEAGAPAADAVS